MNLEELTKYVANINYVQQCLTEGDALAQLAEEAAELAQAALKLRRSIDGTNPARISREDAVENLIEEYSDVSLCWDVLTIGKDGWEGKVTAVSMRKAKRWYDGLCGYTDEWLNSRLTV